MCTRTSLWSNGPPTGKIWNWPSSLIGERFQSACSLGCSFLLSLTRASHPNSISRIRWPEERHASFYRWMKM
ncbi:hypothetical protein MPTK1_1g03930 [Marchantia polymorpha subsp. ruderalis]